MTLLNKSIPNLFNGVSQQAASIRQLSQGEIQENGFSSLVEGLHKRHPTNHVAKVNSLVAPDAYIHTINRDTSERYVVVVVNGDLKVYDINGNEKTVNFPDGKTYLNCTTPRTGFSIITIQDYTLICNRTVTAAMGSATTTTNPTNVAYFYVKAAPAQHWIAASVDGVGSSATLGTSGGTQAGFAAALATNLGTALGAGYSVVITQPEIIKVTKLSGSITSVSASDSYGNQAIACLNTGVNTYSSLPTKFESGYTVQITGDAVGVQTSYYVKYDPTIENWVETVKPGAKYQIDSTTMPFKLVRESDGTFTFSKITWTDRKVGDPAITENPSFIGRAISDIFFYRNRLGFLANENVVFSRAGDYFNYFPQSVPQILDTDPVDVAVSHTKVSNLNHAVPFNKNLVLFSDQTQFMFTANDLLTPKTAAVHQTTEFECSKYSKPVALGSNVYFATEKSGYTGIREYYVMPYQQTFEADDVTSHVPKYIPGMVFKLAASTNEDTLFALSYLERNAIYVYKFYWKGEEKVQSSWSKWILGDSNTTILNIDLIGTKLYLLIQRSDGMYIEYIDQQVGLTEADLNCTVYLDRKVRLTGVYNAATNLTTWTLPYSVTNAQVIYKGNKLTSNQPTGSTITALGDCTAYQAYIGVPYTFKYQFSAQFIKDQAKNSIADGNLRLRTITIFFTNTGYFRVEVTPKVRDTMRYVFTGSKLGDTSSTINSLVLSSGTFKSPVMSDAKTVSIAVVNDSYQPTFLQSAEWEGLFSMRSKRAP